MTNADSKEVRSQADQRPMSTVPLGELSAPLDSVFHALEALPIGVVITRVSDGLILFANRRLTDLLRVPEGTLAGLVTREFYANFDDRRRMFALLARQGYVRDFEVPLRRGDGTIATTSISVERLRCQDDEFTLASVVDVTRLKDTEQSLLAERRLLMRLLELHERDRQLIGYEIHDGLIQDITGALMFLQGTAAEFENQGLAVPEQLHVCEQLLLGSINEARQLISGLQPPVLNEAGVAVAIEHLVQEFRDKNPIQIELQQDPTLARLLPSVEMAIYRIVQESLNNVARHSGASHAWVNLARTDHRILISVRDDGTGFDPESVRKKRYGLVGIRERARLLGGRAVIDSAPGEGTRVTVELPIADTLLDVKNLPVEPPLFGDSI